MPCTGPYHRVMGTDYDKLYREMPDALGAPTPMLLKAFSDHITPPACVLDVGCGQGRDALPLARMGHTVVGVDLSPHGIADLTNAAEKEGLAVTGHVADIAHYVPERRFDVLLFDRSLHMLAPTDRHAALARMIGHLRPGGLLLIADEPRNIPGFLMVLEAAGFDWNRLTDARGYLFAQRR